MLITFGVAVPLSLLSSTHPSITINQFIPLAAHHNLALPSPRVSIWTSSLAYLPVPSAAFLLNFPTRWIVIFKLAAVLDSSSPLLPTALSPLTAACSAMQGMQWEETRILPNFHDNSPEYCHPIFALLLCACARQAWRLMSCTHLVFP
jgi:hypothetical protein